MVIEQEFTFPSDDGIHTVATTWWRPEGPPWGVMQLIHSISKHIGRHDSFARFLAEHDFAIVDHDHLGHNHTAWNPLKFGQFVDQDGWRYVVKGVRALQERAEAEYPGLSCFLLGHFMGSLMVRGHLMFWPGAVDGAILSNTGQEPLAVIVARRALSTPLIRLEGFRIHGTLLDALSVGRYGGQFKPIYASTDWTSRDTVVMDACRADPLRHFLPTVGIYHDMMVDLQLLARPANLTRMNPDTPVYSSAGDRDPVGANGAGVKRVADWSRDAGIEDLIVRFYPEGWYGIPNEINRDEIYRNVLSWLERRLPAQSLSPARPLTRPLRSPPARSPPLPKWGV